MKLADYLILNCNIADVAERLGLENLRKYQHIYHCPCPKGHPSKKAVSFVLYPKRNLFVCFECGIEGNIIDLVSLVRNTDWASSVQWLSETFFPGTIEQFACSDDAELFKKPDRYYINAFLYEHVYEHGKKLFYESDEGKIQLNRLINQRNYRWVNLYKTDWIFLPPEPEIRAYLTKEYHEAQAWISGTPKNSFEDKLPLSGEHGDSFRIGFPYRDRHGLITGFVKRSTARVSRVKWDFTHKMIRDDLFNLNNCVDSKAVIITEGYTGAMYLPVVGLDAFGITAIGKDTLSRRHVMGLHRFDISDVILIFDNVRGESEEEALYQKIENAIALLEAENIETFVVEPSVLDEYKDIEDFVLGNKALELIPKGMEELNKLLKEHTVPAPIWLVNRLMHLYQTADAVNQKLLLDKIWQIRQSIRDVIIQNDFDAILQRELELDANGLQHLFEEIHRDKLQSQLSQTYHSMLKKHLNMEFSKETVSNLQKQLESLLDTAANSPAFRRKELHHRIQRRFDVVRKSGTFSGAIRMHNFAPLMEYTMGFQPGLYLVRGPAAAGKTSFLVNIVLDILLENDSESCLFVSLDETLDSIIDRFFSALFGMPLGEASKDVLEMGEYHPKYQKFFKWIESRRLNIVDGGSVQSVQDVQSEINKMLGKIAVVCIDAVRYLSPDPPGAVMPASGHTLAVSLKSLVFQSELPIVAACREFSTGSDEHSIDSASPDITYLDDAADVVWRFAVRNPGGSFHENEAQQVVIHTLKNKKSYRRDMFSFDIVRETGIKIRNFSNLSETDDSGDIMTETIPETDATPFDVDIDDDNPPATQDFPET